MPNPSMPTTNLPRAISMPSFEHIYFSNNRLSVGDVKRASKEPFWKFELVGGKEEILKGFKAKVNPEIKIVTPYMPEIRIAFKAQNDVPIMEVLYDTMSVVKFDTGINAAILGPSYEGRHQPEGSLVAYSRDCAPILKEVRGFIEASDLAKTDRYKTLLKPVLDRFIDLLK